MGTFEQDNRGILVACPSCGRKNRIRYERLADRVRCGSCKQQLSAPAAPLDVVDTATFDRLIARASIPVVVDYWAPWCAPCRIVAPEIAKVAARNAGRLLVLKVNTDALADVGQRFGIRSIPTLAVFAGGREIARTLGTQLAEDIEAFVYQSVAEAAS